MDLHYPSHPARCIGSVAGHHGGSSCYLKTKTIKQTKISTVHTKSFEYQLHNNTGKMGWNCLNGFGIYMHHDFHHCRQRLFEVGWRAENKREPGKHFMVIRVILEWSRCVCAQDLQLGTSYAFISICKTLCLEKNITITVKQTTCKARTSRPTLLQGNVFLPLTAEEFHCKQTFIHTNTKVSNTVVLVWWAMLDLLCYCDLKMPMSKSVCMCID